MLVLLAGTVAALVAGGCTTPAPEVRIDTVPSLSDTVADQTCCAASGRGAGGVWRGWPNLRRASVSGATTPDRICGSHDRLCATNPQGALVMSVDSGTM